MMDKLYTLLQSYQLLLNHPSLSNLKAQVWGQLLAMESEIASAAPPPTQPPSYDPANDPTNIPTKPKAFPNV